MMAGGDGSVYVLTQLVRAGGPVAFVCVSEDVFWLVGRKNELNYTAQSFPTSIPYLAVSQDFVLFTLLAFVCLYILPRRILRWIRGEKIVHEGKKNE